MGINHIDKQDFLSLYSEIRLEGLSTSNIHSAFRATGLVPYDPELVLAKLYIQLRTPTPPSTTDSPPWVPATPHDIRTLNCQTTAFKEYLRRRTKSPPEESP